MGGGGLLGAWHVAVIPALRRQRKEDGKVGDSEASLGCHKQTSSSSKTVRKVFSRALHLTISWFTSLLVFLWSAWTLNALNRCSITSTQQNKEALLLLNNSTSSQLSPILKRLWNTVSYAKVVWGTPKRLDNCTRAKTSFSRCHNNSSKCSHSGRWGRNYPDRKAERF